MEKGKDSYQILMIINGYSWLFMSINGYINDYINGYINDYINGD